MKFDTQYIGKQGFHTHDSIEAGANYGEVREALFQNPYYLTWGADNEPPLPDYSVTLGRVIRGLLPGGEAWHFREAAARTLKSRAVLRWGENNRGFRRLLHPNGVCLLGRWKIDKPSDYTGYFQNGREALIVARYSTCCTESRRGKLRSLSLVGTLFPTTNPDHPDKLRTASFITQEDIGGERTDYINDAITSNAPNVTPWRRGWGTPVLLLTGVAFMLVDREPTQRQLYEVAELEKPQHVPTRAPRFMRLVVDESQPRIPGADLDFRDEILAQIYDRGDAQSKRRLRFNIDVTDKGRSRGKLIQRRHFEDWNRLGHIDFTEAVASYNGDFVLHMHHPPWRTNRNDPSPQSH